MDYNRTYLKSEIMNKDVLNGIQDDIINTVIPHLEQYGMSFSFTKHTYTTNEFPLISNISAIEEIIDDMGEAIDYTLPAEFSSYYYWIPKKDWTTSGKKIFGAEDLNRWCNNMTILNLYETPPTYEFVKIATPTKLNSAKLLKTMPTLKNGDEVYSISGNAYNYLSNWDSLSPTKYDIVNNTIDIANETNLSVGNALCIQYGSYIYAFGGLKRVRKGTGIYIDVNPQCYYKYDVDNDEWEMENDEIKKFECPYTFQNDCCSVIFYNSKMLFAYTEIDEEDITVFDYEGNADVVYSEDTGGHLHFIEFDPANDTWTEKSWGSISIYRDYRNYKSYNRMITAPTNKIYVATLTQIDNELKNCLYKIENDNIELITTNLPGMPTKMYLYINDIYMICNQDGEYADRIYKYNLMTGETELLHNGYSGFGPATKYISSYYFDDDHIYKIDTSEVYELQQVYN